MDPNDALDQVIPDAPLRWAWVVAGVLVGALLIALVVYLIDPGLERPAESMLLLTLSLILVGLFVGYGSEGETIREAALAGVVLILLLAAFALAVLGTAVPAMVWILGPFYSAALAMAGAWVGEMLQGTLDEAHDDEAIDWPWVFVSVLIGFTVATYLVFVGRALIGFTPGQGLGVFAASFLITGWIVGRFSSGVTMVEPAIAAAAMVVIDSAFLILWFEGLSVSWILIGFCGGALLALLGGWLGERSQRRRRRPAKA